VTRAPAPGSGSTCSRRSALRALAAAGCALPGFGVPAEGPARAGLDAREARHYRRLPGGKVQCGLCPWACLVDEGRRGRCGVRENRGGVYRSLVYGRVAAEHVDPIEKKPFFHFLPGSAAYSVATVGCNFHCAFCQNWDLSQRRPEDAPAPAVAPEALARRARDAGCRVMAYTYSEPTVFYETVADTAAAARGLGLRNVVVSNGFIQKAPLEALAPVLDAYKVDLKSFDDGFYRKVCDGRLKPVLDTLVRLKALSVWCEIVVLLVPTLNDGEAEIRSLSRWIAAELGPDVPLHFSRFQPQYRLRNLPPTPSATLERARALAREEGLRYVYLGNLPGRGAENTACPECGALVLSRSGFDTIENRMRAGACGACGRAIPGVWA
jgi:pyruvate formate lyase activating enzyme